MKKWLSGALIALSLIPSLSLEAEARKRTRSWSCARCRVTVKSHYRRSSTGKTYRVRSYTRKRGYGN